MFPPTRYPHTADLAQHWLPPHLLSIGHSCYHRSRYRRYRWLHRSSPKSYTVDFGSYPTSPYTRSSHVLNTARCHRDRLSSVRCRLHLHTDRISIQMHCYRPHPLASMSPALRHLHNDYSRAPPRQHGEVNTTHRYLEYPDTALAAVKHNR